MSGEGVVINSNDSDGGESNNNRNNNNSNSNSNSHGRGNDVLPPLQSDSNVSYSSNSFRGDDDDDGSISIAASDDGANDDENLEEVDEDDQVQDQDQDHDHSDNEHEDDNGDDSHDSDDGGDEHYSMEEERDSLLILDNVTDSRRNAIQGSLSQEGVEVQLDVEPRLDDDLSYCTKPSNTFDESESNFGVLPSRSRSRSRSRSMSSEKGFTKHGNTFDDSDFSTTTSPPKSPVKRITKMMVQEEEEIDEEKDHGVMSDSLGKNENVSESGDEDKGENGSIQPTHNDNINSVSPLYKVNLSPSKINTKQIPQASQLVGLFDQPPESELRATMKTVNFQRQTTERTVNTRSGLVENNRRRDIFSTPGSPSAWEKPRETDPLLQYQNLADSYTNRTNGYNKDFNGNVYGNVYGGDQHEMKKENKVQKTGSSNMSFTIPTTKSLINGVLSSIIFGLFHIVFCLAQASAVTRPFSKRSSIGQMVRVASMSTIISTPIYLVSMIKSFPDLYPAIDSFPVPFYAQIALIIDDMLHQEGLGNDDMLFLTTFCVVTGIGLILTGVLLALATKFKLANLGFFIPYPVMGGFFSTIGLLIWTLAFSVDTGKHVGEVFVSHIRDYDELRNCSLHHVGSIIVAIIMLKASAINNSLVPIITMMTIPGAYLILFFTKTTLEDARAMGWFWYDHDFRTTGEKSGNWEPPLPFGVIEGIFEGKVDWIAVRKALPISIAMALIYFIRCSLHVPALKKTRENIQKYRDEQEKKQSNSNVSIAGRLSRRFSFLIGDNDDDDDDDDNDSFEIESTRPGEKASPMSMSDVYSVYGKILALVGLAGGSACLPALGRKYLQKKLSFFSKLLMIIYTFTSFVIFLHAFFSQCNNHKVSTFKRSLHVFFLNC